MTSGGFLEEMSSGADDGDYTRHVDTSLLNWLDDCSPLSADKALTLNGLLCPEHTCLSV